MFNVCKKNDPNFDKCFKTAVQDVIPDLGEGYPKLRIPAIEPFELPSLEIDHGKGSSKSVSIDLKMKDVKIKGLTSTVIDYLKTDLDNYKLNGKISFSKPLEITGHYTVNGKVLVLPITGSGPCSIVLREYSRSFLLQSNSIFRSFSFFKSDYFFLQYNCYAQTIPCWT